MSIKVEVFPCEICGKGELLARLSNVDSGVPTQYELASYTSIRKDFERRVHNEQTR